MAVVAFVVLAVPSVVLADGRVALVVGNSTQAFRYALRPEQIDSIIGYLKRVETLRPPVVDRLVELSSPSVADPVSFGETAGPLWGTVTSTSGEEARGRHRVCPGAGAERHHERVHRQ